MHSVLLLLALLGGAAKPGAAPALNEVPGLKLTPNQTVPVGRLAVVKADCSGPVAWEVVPVGTFDVSAEVEDLRVILAAPPPGQTVVVLAVGVVEGKPTRFAKSFVTAEGPAPTPPAPAPGPAPGPTPAPTPAPKPSGQVYGYFFVDPSGDPNVSALVSSQALANALRTLGVQRKILAANDPLAARVAAEIAAAGGVPALILMDEKKTILGKIKVTASQDDLLAAIKKALGK